MSFVTNSTILAREDQSLLFHLQETASLARHYAEAFGLGYTAYTCGLLHDLGKFSKAFQRYLYYSLSGKRVHRGEVPHAWEGALTILNKLEEDKNDISLADILSNVVASHHGGLTDMVVDAERVMPNRLNTHLKFHSEEFQDALENSEAVTLLESVNWDIVQQEFLNLCEKIRAPFARHFVVKFLYSCLIDADRCNAAGMGKCEQITDWSAIESCIDKRLEGFARVPIQDKSPLDAVRKSISDQCAEQAMRAPGVFTLSVPTGGGKTLSSLRFAIRHARKNGLKRIIYVIPYLSIIDQTADEFRKLFGKQSEEWILEHHSNFLLDCDNEDDEKRYDLGIQRWDAPIIITTMVQFLESIFSNKSSDLRKFHNMTQSVFVFDEVQALPVKCTHMFNGAVNFLNKFGDSSCVLCSATQPALANVKKPLRLSLNPDLVSLSPESKELFRRTRLIDKTKPELTCEEIAELALLQFQKGESTLIVMNTKGEARKVFMALDANVPKHFLSTDMCPRHRLDVITQMRNALDINKKELKQPILCVSTQLIEAGVDISFDCVIRAEAGFDSIIQVAGRCNRHGHSKTPQDVIIIRVADEDRSLANLPEIKLGKRLTERIIDEELLQKQENALETYYFYKFGQPEQQILMDYPIDDRRTLYDSLGRNIREGQNYRDAHEGIEYSGLLSAFQSAAENFSVIEGFHIGVVVPYDNNGQANDVHNDSSVKSKSVHKLVEDFIQTGKSLEHIYEHEERTAIFKERSRILRSLQQYTISVYANQESAIQKIATKIDDAFYLLGDHYDPVMGLTEIQGLLAF